MNMDEAAHWFFHEWRMLGDRDPDDLTGVEEAFHDWCEANDVPARHRNTIWREVVPALGIVTPESQ